VTHSPDKWDTGGSYSFGMDGDDLRPVRLFRTPWTVSRMAADTCIWIAWRDPADPEQPAIEELLRLRREGRVEIAKTDTVDTERTDGVPDAKATDRLLETAGIIELHGPVVVGHSRWDHAVFASDEDSDRIDGVFAVLFPDSDRNAMDRTSIHKLRDAMHIATAIRYGYDVFVTAETRLLKKADAIRREWGIEILCPSNSVRWVEHRIELERVRSERH
jgi:hypothetical protein